MATGAAAADDLDDNFHNLLSLLDGTLEALSLAWGDVRRGAPVAADTGDGVQQNLSRCAELFQEANELARLAHTQHPLLVYATAQKLQKRAIDYRRLLSQFQRQQQQQQQQQQDDASGDRLCRIYRPGYAPLCG
eukprot:TRINITY_DN8307_c0_g1_i1.p2 TRINITY_DN8307_c0_g1~~TRINITY_DN8307_c0_g1_i1.p2  ORF type:complete len:134 (+),score=31.09 TRINITY_DN8307_c0_g1_i1:308-709(+)